MKILAIDPGTIHSAFVLYEDGKLLDKGILANENMAGHIRDGSAVDVVVLEFIQAYGMAVGREVFETVCWCGKFMREAERRRFQVLRVGRPTVKSFVTGASRSGDSQVRQALLLKYGGAKKGEPLEGVKKDIWAALAVADYAHHTLRNGDFREW